MDWDDEAVKISRRQRPKAAPNAAGVLKILEKAVMLLTETPTGGRFISLRDVFKAVGSDTLKP